MARGAARYVRAEGPTRRGDARLTLAWGAYGGSKRGGREGSDGDQRRDGWADSAWWGISGGGERGGGGAGEGRGVGGLLSIRSSRRARRARQWFWWRESEKGEGIWRLGRKSPLEREREREEFDDPVWSRRYRERDRQTEFDDAAGSRRKIGLSGPRLRMAHWLQGSLVVAVHLPPLDRVRPERPLL